MTERQLQGYTEITVEQKGIVSLDITVNMYQSKIRGNKTIYTIPILSPSICICDLMIQITQANHITNACMRHLLTPCVKFSLTNAKRKWIG